MPYAHVVAGWAALARDVAWLQASRDPHPSPGSRPPGGPQATLTTLQVPPRTPATADPRSLSTVWSCLRLAVVVATQLEVVTEQAGAQVDLPTWLRKPERFNDQAGTLEAIVEHLVLGMGGWGAGYLWAAPLDRRGDSWSLHPIEPARVMVTFVERHAPPYHRRRDYRVDTDVTPLARRAMGVEGSGGFTPARAGLLPVPYLTMPGRAEHVGPIQACRIALGYHQSTEEYAGTVFSRGTTSGGRLETDLDMTAEDATRMGQAFVDMVTAGQMPVLSSGLKYLNDVINPKDAQWLESREFDAQTQARIYGCPPLYLGLSAGDSVTYQNARDNDARLLRSFVAAFTRPIATALNTLTGPGRTAHDETVVRFSFDGWLLPTPADLWPLLGGAVTDGLITPETARAIGHLPAAPEETP